VLLEAISRLQGMPHWLHYARSADMIRCYVCRYVVLAPRSPRGRLTVRFRTNRPVTPIPVAPTTADDNSEPATAGSATPRDPALVFDLSLRPHLDLRADPRRRATGSAPAMW
jgi:hypothetical protein